ncbi:MAG TPA: hypothetical protein DDY70_00595 [Clostridiales bacterium]|nr:hypothetical protein [Clostridiales bacterium]
MKIKDKIWDKEKHWFRWKFRLIFLLIGLVFTLLMILELTVWGPDPVRSMLFSFCSWVFYLLFLVPVLAPIVEKLP